MTSEERIIVSIYTGVLMCDFGAMRVWGEVMSQVWGGNYTEYAWSYKVVSGKSHWLQP